MFLDVFMVDGQKTSPDYYKIVILDAVFLLRPKKHSYSTPKYSLYVHSLSIIFPSSFMSIILFATVCVN